MSNLSPNDLVVNREELKKVEATTTKSKGDFNGSFTLSIKFTKSVKKFDKSTGEEVDSQSQPFYMKWQGKKEDTIDVILKKCDDLAKRYSNSMECANLYFNLNRGGRVNSFVKVQGLEFPKVKNIKLKSYNSKGVCTWTMPDTFIVHLPKLLPEDVTLERLNIYRNSLISYTKHINEKQAEAIYEYLKYYYFNSSEPSAHPYPASNQKKEQEKEVLYDFKSQQELTEFCKIEMLKGAAAETMREFWKKQNNIIKEKNKFFADIAEEEEKLTQETHAPEIKKDYSDIKTQILEMKTKRIPYNRICERLNISKQVLRDILETNINK